MMWSLYRPYLTPEMLRGFDAYKYSSVDTSPLSNYVMHPFWNGVVKLCPRWVAPNLLTFVGFICCIGHYALAAFYDYDFTANDLESRATAPIPAPVWLWVSLLLFLAHTLDGIDGKQARRTNTSTPLGELFDHGCDSWSTVFICTTFYSAFGRNADGFSISVWDMYLILWSVFFSFHISHWEKYNTGIMYLPWSYDIAMVGGSVLYLLTGLLGFETWKTKLPGGCAAGSVLQTLLYMFTYGLATPVALGNIIKSYQTGKGKMLPALEAVRPLFSFIVAFILCMVWAQWSSNDILEKDVRMFFLMSGTIYANMSCRLIVAQMSGTRCELFNVLLWPLAMVVLCSMKISMSYTAELGLLYVLAVLCILVHTHYNVCVVIQMCQHFKIKCFSITNAKN